MGTMATGRNGQVIDRARLQIDEETLTRIESRDPEVRGRLEEVELWELTYWSDGLKVKGILARPKATRTYPCVIYNRGGSRDSGLITPEDAAAHLARIASWGYGVVASQYRGNGGSEGREEFGGADIGDVLNLIPLIKELPDADPAHIGMWGWSRGGLMTYRALALTNRLAAAIIMSGVTDAFDYVARRPDMEQGVFAETIADYAENKAAALELRSAIRWPERLCKQTPILLLHGGGDWRVHPTQALRMAAALYEHKHPFRFVFYEGGDHALKEYETEVYELCKSWLDRYVRDRQPWPSLEPHGT